MMVHPWTPSKRSPSAPASSPCRPSPFSAAKFGVMAGHLERAGFGVDLDSHHDKIVVDASGAPTCHAPARPGRSRRASDWERRRSAVRHPAFDVKPAFRRKP